MTTRRALEKRLRLIRVLVFMLGSWVGGVWIAWGMTGYITEVICTGTTWRWSDYPASATPSCA